MDSHEIKKNKTQLDSRGRRGVLRELLFIPLSLVILLSVAGRIDWINAWMYTGLLLTLRIFYLIYMIRKNPELINERARGIKKDTKKFDRLFFALWIPLIFSVLIVAALDAGRFGWSKIPLHYSIAGCLLSLPGYLFSMWAISTNTHFEATVRIQKDRKHTVITTGPYKYVRHPGYVGGMAAMLCFPLLLGSCWAFIPTLLIIVLFFIRTYLEDETLHRELPEYPKYARNTRYRIIPFLW